MRLRGVLVVSLAVCLLALAASAPGRPVLGNPLWTGSVSLNGFTLGPGTLYMTKPDGKAVAAVDLLTGRLRWSRAVEGLPLSIDDVGNGVAVVMTRPPSGDDPDRPGSIITLVRDATGEQIAATSGEHYQSVVDGRLLLVYSNRSRGADDCAAAENICMDITAWDVNDGVAMWQLDLPPNTGVVQSYVDDRVGALAEINVDGTVRVRDITTGAVTGIMSLPPEVLHSGGQVGLVHGMLLAAGRGPEGITLTAYNRPSLARTWSVVVPDFTEMNDQGDGFLYPWACGPDVCLTVSGSSTRVINQSTGEVGAPITYDIATRVGAGVFLGTRLHSPGGNEPTEGYVIDQNGRAVDQLGKAGLVDWSESGNRALVMQDGPERTGFLVIDDRGAVRRLGSVPGTRLTCSARADILACSDGGGTLRVWRLPL